MSYRDDADIPLKYGGLSRLNKNETEAVIHQSSSHLDEITNNFAVNNTHLAEKPRVSESGAFVAQFVSNCDTKSEREKLVKSLS